MQSLQQPCEIDIMDSPCTDGASKSEKVYVTFILYVEVFLETLSCSKSEWFGQGLILSSKAYLRSAYKEVCELKNMR